VGSALKPFLYLLAFENFNWNPDSIVYDKPSGFDTGTGFFYEPQNYDLQFRGAITLRQALAESRNVPAVQILQKIGGSEFFGFLEKFGITTRVASESDFGLSAALGSFDIRPIDLAHAYGVLARGGRNFEFQIFKNSQNPYSEQIADCQKVFDIIDILSDDAARINAFHTKNPLEFPFAVAVKTGTTRNFRDNWTVGFSDQVGVLVWVGNADGAPMKDVSGITGAGPLFHALMTEAMKGKEGHQKFSEQQICGINSDENKNIPKNTEDVESVSDSSLHILSPLSGQTFRISPERPLTFQKLQFKSSQAGDWFVDGVYIGSGKEILWIPEKGRHEILIKAGQESKLVTITVL
jgi:penicillin-binding protein 1C